MKNQGKRKEKVLLAAVSEKSGKADKMSGKFGRTVTETWRNVAFRIVEPGK